MTTTDFDFRKPPPGALERHVTAWLTAACRRAADVWAGELPFPAAIQLVRVESLSASACLRRSPKARPASRSLRPTRPAAFCSHCPTRFYSHLSPV